MTDQTPAVLRGQSSSGDLTRRSCECENPHRTWYLGRDGDWHCEQCDGLAPLACPGCGATADAGCVLDVDASHFDREVIGRQLLCVGHERPYWLQPKEIAHG